MPRTRKVVGVHERTVQKAANIVPFKKPRKRPAASSLDLEHIKVDPRVWKIAVRLCKGNPKRIQIVSDAEVVVHNNNWKGSYAAQA